MTGGPTCPVERPDQPCAPNPVIARVEALDDSGQLTGTANTDREGRYAISLPPGDYTLQVDPGGTFPRYNDITVTVPSGPPVTADIECDTGIR